MKNIVQIAWLIPFLPLAGFLINGLLRKRLSRPAVSVVGSGVILASFIISLVVFFQVKSGNAQLVHYFNFIDTGSLKIGFDFQLDQLSALFLLIITGVGFLIHVYSVAYMHEEEPKDFARYFAYLNLFVFSMLLLVMGGNYVIMFIGWEGVGLCSYLLIGYWFKNINYTAAAKKAFIMNRIGDLGFLLAVFWLLQKVGSTDYATVFANISTKLTPADITGITILLFIGATGKSAQIPLYTWLPDAMAGPTPVSALIHAATMVTAGVYMIARSNALYSLAHLTQEIVMWVGLATALLAATIALKQYDIKKVLAYSTVSQLGFMFIALGTGNYVAAVFHVMTHAFFKALLFLGSGSVIHGMHHEQDIRQMGGLAKKMKVTYITFVIGCLAIAGCPLFSGFFSKDAILIGAFEHNKIVYAVALFTACLTAYYMFRLLFITFSGKFRGTEDQWHHVHESPALMTVPLIILAILSVVGGYINVPEVLGGHQGLTHFLAPVIPVGEATHLSHTTEYMLMGGAVLLIATAVVLAWNKCKNFVYRESEGIAKTLENKWYVDELYEAVVVKPLNALGGLFNTVVEKKIIDGFINGVGRAVNYSSRQVRLLQSGQVGTYVLMMVIGILVLFIIQLF
ncbi:MAG TPA: NADH-quinone oxidoreductase subunit L [Ferruginibacter sp.]|nr:NADH-quinone oxidoreductase subunit L [Ferruginibacter sp.]HMP21308.1 NADH-quinone oxidoreductase subunit L [Ferruginibacter sp.]